MGEGTDHGAPHDTASSTMVSCPTPNPLETGQGAEELPATARDCAAAAVRRDDDSPNKVKMRSVVVKLPDKVVLSQAQPRRICVGAVARSPDDGGEAPDSLVRERHTLGPGDAGLLGTTGRLSLGPGNRPDMLHLSRSGRLSIGHPNHAGRKTLSRDEIRSILAKTDGSRVTLG